MSVPEGWHRKTQRILRNDGRRPIIGFDFDRPGWPRTLAALAALAVAYWALSVGGLQWAMVKGAGSPVWPAAGVALAGLLLGGVRLWPAIFIGRLAAAATIGSAQPLWADALIAVGNTLAAVIPVLVIQRLTRIDLRLARMTDVLWVAVVGAAGGAAIAATVGTAVLSATGALPVEQLARAWLGWWLGNLVGGLTIATLILSWWRADSISGTASRLHFAACMLTVAALSYLLFVAPVLPLLRTWHLYPALIWAAVAFSVRGASAAMVIASGFAIWGIGSSGTVFATIAPDLDTRLLLAQQFAAVSSLVTLILGAAADERRGKEELQEARNRLDQLNQLLAGEVRERTRERDRLWELSQDLLVVADFEGRILAANPAWDSLSGWTEEKLGDTGYMELVHPDDVEATERILNVLGEGRTVLEFENRLRDIKGQYHWISWRAVPEDGRIYATGRDVTEDRARQEELAATQEQLRQSQKMEAMGQLTGGVAHDFNNLLTPIIGFLDVLHKRLDGDDRARGMIDAALSSADRAKILVQRLLAFARRQPLQPKSIDPGDLLAAMRDLVASTCGPRASVRLDLSPDLPPVLADRNQLEMAILNLAVNARDAMPDGGTLTLSAKVEKPPPDSDLPSSEHVKIAIVDTGVGMDEETARRAVEPFFSTKGVGKGTGLGLSMAHGLMAQLGGALTIRSRKGLGTAIELWLPLSRSLPETGSSERKQSGRQTGLVLLVDDEDLARASTAELLRDLGYRVEESDSAEQALGLLGDGIDPDLILTDHLMPGMTGEELATELRNRKVTTPLLIVSGYADVEELDPAIPRLVKPFRGAELEAAIAKLSAGAGSSRRDG
ncbi:MAG TPA: MASE1 domain-containing protein [Sphingomicrobium sp.]|nr:MASE1 domain-containing protein [Sphingomicrobium sp.]